MLKTSFPIAAALLTFAAVPAVAQPAPTTRIVSYADLDLSAAAGRARLEQRIRAAVRTVCGQPSPTDLLGVYEVRACRSETLANVQADRRVGRVFLAQRQDLSGAAGIQ
jgi:UrcA family protein